MAKEKLQELWDIQDRLDTELHNGIAYVSEDYHKKEQSQLILDLIETLIKET